MLNFGLSKLKNSLQLGKPTKLINLYTYSGEKERYDTT